MKVILFNVYDSFCSTDDFGWDVNCDLENQDFEIDNGFLCTDQAFIEDVQNYESRGECFTFNVMPDFFNQNNNPVKEYLIYGEDFMIHSLPDSTTDCEVITRFDKEFKHLYQEALYVVDGKIKHIGWGEE